MPSSEEYIRNALSKFIEDLNSPISFSKSVQFNLENIQEVNRSGFTISYIMKSISMKQTEATFRNAIARARKKQERKSEENTSSKERAKISTSSTTSNIDSKENTINIDKYSEDEWVKAWGFSLSKGLTPLMIAELMKYGWTPHNYHKLKDKHNLFNSKRLINISSDMKRHKATNKDYQ